MVADDHPPSNGIYSVNSTNSASPDADSAFNKSNTRFPSSQPDRKPLAYSGNLDRFEFFEVTTIIGREYPSVQLSHLLASDQNDLLLRDLAVVVSQRGVVFFRNQDITIEQQKVLTQKLGALSGKPESSTLHIRPLFNGPPGPQTRPMNETGERDPEIYVIENESEWIRKKNILERVRYSPASAVWHTDSTFENVPSDYACLKMVIPSNPGGDTLWASGYELYDRLSPSFASYLSTLSTTSKNTYFKQFAKQEGFELMSPRGSPHNSLSSSSPDSADAKEHESEDFTATHPVVRTNPVTGWRGLYVVPMYFGKINELNDEESKLMKGYIERLLVHNHDLQVRFKWGKNDVAIWDNRSVFHCATHDDVGERLAYRVLSVGERPYFDPASKSRREALAAEHKAYEN